MSTQPSARAVEQRIARRRKAARKRAERHERREAAKVATFLARNHHELCQVPDYESFYKP